MGKNIYGLESETSSRDGLLTQAQIVPVGTKYISSITIEGDDGILYRREQPFDSPEKARIDLHAQLRFMGEVSVDDLVRIASAEDYSESFWWADHRYISAAVALAGVPPTMFKAWAQSHDQKQLFGADSTFENLDKFAQNVGAFLQEAAQMGSPTAQKSSEVAQQYAMRNPPVQGEVYSQQEAEKHIAFLDRILNRVHEDVLKATGTTREQWYAAKPSKTKDPHMTTPVMYLTPEEQRELGIVQEMSPEKLRERRGPMAPFYENLWERRTQKRRKEVEAAEESGEFDTHEPKSIGDVKPKLHYLGEMIMTTVMVKRAGSTENYLQSLGVQPDVIQFVMSQPEDVAKRLVNEVRKNTALTTDQLQQMAQGFASQQKYEPTQREHAQV